MQDYTIRYVRGHEPGIHVTTIRAHNEEEAINKFYAAYPNCAVVYV